VAARPALAVVPSNAWTGYRSASCMPTSSAQP
jgi:hypothetical protein